MKINPAWLAHGNVMRRARVARQESLADAARRAGVPRRLVGDIEHGRADPALLDRVHVLYDYVVDVPERMENPRQ